LPFDQQYDVTKVNGKDEFMAMTVAEAESAGFRRAYENKKTELLNTYTFLDAPVKSNEVYELPVTEFFYKNYHMRVIPDEEYIDFCACKSFALIGFDDENKRIVYCYHYSFDLDYIAEEDEDLEAEMCEFMNEVFEWKNDDLHQ
jgi:hypothetical protein